jgi:hypothetical protein
MTPFAPPITGRDRSSVEFFPRNNADERLNFISTEEEEKQENAALARENGAQPQEGAAKDDAAKYAKLAPREKLLAKYGDPSKDAPVLAIENAPTPFKAMMESLQEQDREMAFQYAKQYVRHLRNLQDRSTEVMSLVGFAQKRESMIEGSEWSKTPALEEHRAIYQKELEQAVDGAQDEAGVERAARMILNSSQQSPTSQATSRGGAR